MDENTTVAVSDLELLGVWQFFRNDTAWGGSPELLSAQLELWEACGLNTKYAGLPPQFTVDAVSDVPASYPMSAAASAVLRAVLSRPGQGIATGLPAARALRRLASGTA